MTSSWGESTSRDWFLHTKEPITRSLFFLYCWSEQSVEQTVELLITCDVHVIVMILWINNVINLCQKYLQVRRISYLWALRSLLCFMFTGHLFQIKLHLLSAVLLSGFQSSPGAYAPLFLLLPQPILTHWQLDPEKQISRVFRQKGPIGHA